MAKNDCQLFFKKMYKNAGKNSHNVSALYGGRLHGNQKCFTGPDKGLRSKAGADKMWAGAGVGIEWSGTTWQNHSQAAYRPGLPKGRYGPVTCNMGVYHYCFNLFNFN
jgi:hypothetical protein